jgi:leucyl/phenylalanyl-tRNA---protein transferase
MLPYLNNESPFPPQHLALSDPNGLLAAGASLSMSRLLDAYSKGIFPWYSDGEPIMWWSPDPRTVFFIDQFKVNKSVIKTLKKLKLKVTLNQAFEEVIQCCSEPRLNKQGQYDGTWITQEMMDAYINMHLHGHAHSIEVWQNGELVGGIYGIASGKVFCGESMFSHISNASKIALSCLISYLKQYHFNLVDCQVENPHLLQLGAINISRKLYLDFLAAGQNMSLDQSIWEPKELEWTSLLKKSKRD